MLVVRGYPLGLLSSTVGLPFLSAELPESFSIPSASDGVTQLELERIQFSCIEAKGQSRRGISSKSKSKSVALLGENKFSLSCEPQSYRIYLSCNPSFSFSEGP